MNTAISRWLAAALLALAAAGGFGHPGHGGQVLPLELAKAFSGKLDPLLAVGLKMGDYALHRLKAEKFSVQVVAALKLEPPQSYLLDGLQVATGATLGNHHLAYRPAENFQVTFESPSGEQLTLALSERFAATLEQWLKEWGDPEIVALYMSLLQVS